LKKALVIIDVQQGMFDVPDFQPYDGQNVLARIADLTARARAAGAPVYFIQHDGGPTHPFHPGKSGYPFHPAIAPRAGDNVTVKHFSSAFHGTDFDSKLKRDGVDHLVVTGMQSEYCVNSAIRGAYERGYGITLVSDAHSTGDTRVAKAKDIIAIQNDTMRGDFGDVVPAAEVTF
jgi:nicotinamidase-related amidase